MPLPFPYCWAALCAAGSLFRSGRFRAAGLSDFKAVDGCPVKNAFHTPMIPPAPGLGFFVNSFRGRLNICLTSTGAVLSRFEHNRLLELLQADFL
jgi:hypothetical protein